MADEEVRWNIYNVIRDWPLSRKISLASVVLFSLTLFAVLILQARQVNNQMLFANLSESDASAIVTWLKDSNIPYELRGDGRSIYIPAEMVHETRLQLASSGLPQGGGVGFEIFDKQSLGITDFVQKVNYQRALQGSCRVPLRHWLPWKRHAYIWLYQKNVCSRASNRNLLLPLWYAWSQGEASGTIR